MAKFVSEFFGVADGEVWPKTFNAGDDCPPGLEDAAFEAGAIEADDGKADGKAEGDDGKKAKVADAKK
jgi:hypothetical protein